MTDAAERFLDQVKSEADEAGVFGPTEIVGGYLKCAAADSAEPAWYCLQSQAGRWHVSLVTHDHGLSESIEADLMQGDESIEELLENELARRGHLGDGPPVSRFRSAELLYTFRSPVPSGDGADGEALPAAVRSLLAYEATFRRLGDMRTENGEDD